MMKMAIGMIGANAPAVIIAESGGLSALDAKIQDSSMSPSTSVMYGNCERLLKT
jgi:hypothetical protein